MMTMMMTTMMTTPAVAAAMPACGARLAIFEGPEHRRALMSHPAPIAPAPPGPPFGGGAGVVGMQAVRAAPTTAAQIAAIQGEWVGWAAALMP